MKRIILGLMLLGPAMADDWASQCSNSEVLCVGDKVETVMFEKGQDAIEMGKNIQCNEVKKWDPNAPTGGYNVVYIECWIDGDKRIRVKPSREYGPLVAPSVQKLEKLYDKRNNLKD